MVRTRVFKKRSDADKFAASERAKGNFPSVSQDIFTGKWFVEVFRPLPFGKQFK